MKGPVPTNATIVFGNLRWAWAYPLPAADGMDGNYQFLNFGWRLPTTAELSLAPSAMDFLFTGGNVPFNGTDASSSAYFDNTNAAYSGDGACATPWFSSDYYHCDWQDGNGQACGPWAGTPAAESFADQLVVQDVVPEPSTWLLLSMGMAALALCLRSGRLFDNGSIPRH